MTITWYRYGIFYTTFIRFLTMFACPFLHILYSREMSVSLFSNRCRHSIGLTSFPNTLQSLIFCLKILRPEYLVLLSRSTLKICHLFLQSWFLFKIPNLCKDTLSPCTHSWKALSWRK